MARKSGCCVSAVTPASLHITAAVAWPTSAQLPPRPARAALVMYTCVSCVACVSAVSSRHESSTVVTTAICKPLAALQAAGAHLAFQVQCFYLLLWTRASTRHQPWVAASMLGLSAHRRLQLWQRGLKEETTHLSRAGCTHVREDTGTACLAGWPAMTYRRKPSLSVGRLAWPSLLFWKQAVEALRPHRKLSWRAVPSEAYDDCPDKQQQGGWVARWHHAAVLLRFFVHLRHVLHLARSGRLPDTASGGRCPVRLVPGRLQACRPLGRRAEPPEATGAPPAAEQPGACRPGLAPCTGGPKDSTAETCEQLW